MLDIDNARERFLTQNEIKILFENSKNDETLFLLFNLALKTGGRLETLLKHSKKNIDFTHSLLTLKYAKLAPDSGKIFIEQLPF